MTFRSVLVNNLYDNRGEDKCNQHKVNSEMFNVVNNPRPCKMFFMCLIFAV